jgi:hypothetical protein
MMAAALPTNREKGNETKRRKKLEKVVSTKLSIEDYNRFHKFTNLAYMGGFIDEPYISMFLRYVITVPFKGLPVESENKDS